MKNINFLLLIGIVTIWIFSCSGSGTSEQANDEGADSTESALSTARVYFIAPADGDSVTSPFIVEMGIEGMEIDPAGEIKEGMGHHHLVINGSFIDKGVVVPTDSLHIHYGKGQTMDTIELVPGNYTLTLQFADGVHQSYGETLSNTINIVVKNNN